MKGDSMLSGGFIASLIFFFVLVIVFALGIVRLRVERKDHDVFWGPTMIAVSGLCMVVMLFATFPYQAQYHSLELHTGKVVKVEQRIVTDGGKYANITKEVAFWLDGEKDAYITDDVRLTNVKPGQTIVLRRQASWVYGGEDYFNVTYVAAPST